MSTPEYKTAFSVVASDERALRSIYMPFIKNGGFFIPTQKRYKLGERVFLLLALNFTNEVIRVVGDIVWITDPAARTNNAPSGIGVQCDSTSVDGLHEKIKVLLLSQEAAVPTSTYII